MTLLNKLKKLKAGIADNNKEVYKYFVLDYIINKVNNKMDKRLSDETISLHNSVFTEIYNFEKYKAKSYLKEIADHFAKCGLFVKLIIGYDDLDKSDRYESLIIQTSLYEIKDSDYIDYFMEFKRLKPEIYKKADKKANETLIQVAKIIKEKAIKKQITKQLEIRLNDWFGQMIANKNESVFENQLILDFDDVTGYIMETEPDIKTYITNILTKNGIKTHKIDIYSTAILVGVEISI